MAGHRFAVSGLALPGGGDLFGVWDAPADGPVSYTMDEAAAPAAPAAPVWHVQLPEALDTAQLLLDARGKTLDQGTKDVQEAERRMAQIEPGAAVSYAARSGDIMLTPEDRLIDAVQALRSPVFDTRETAVRDDARAGWQKFLGDVTNMLSHVARVETQIGAVPVGYTAVSWTGNYNTTWQRGSAPAYMDLHQQSLHLALAWRIALLRLVVVVSRGAARIAARLAVPGPQQVLVVPEAWRFVQDVLEELRVLWPQLPAFN